MNTLQYIQQILCFDIYAGNLIWSKVTCRVIRQGEWVSRYVAVPLPPKDKTWPTKACAIVDRSTGQQVSTCMADVADYKLLELAEVELARWIIHEGEHGPREIDLSGRM